LFCKNYVRKFRSVTTETAKSCRNRSSVEIGSSSIFPLFRSVAGQPIIDADEPRHTAAATATAAVYGNGNGYRERRNGNGRTATEWWKPGLRR